jgi:hypothetical protein
MFLLGTFCRFMSTDLWLEYFFIQVENSQMKSMLKGMLAYAFLCEYMPQIALILQQGMFYERFLGQERIDLLQREWEEEMRE